MLEDQHRLFETGNLKNIYYLKGQSHCYEGLVLCKTRIFFGKQKNMFDYSSTHGVLVVIADYVRGPSMFC